MSLLVSLLVGLVAFLFVLFVYDLAISFAGFLPLQPSAATGLSGVRFAVLIPAHNEERVVANAVASVQAQDYPPERVRIFVIADNATDGTAEVARAAGATVIERHTKTERTKGYALQFAIGQVLAMNRFDAICVFDADNLAAPNFLRAMETRLSRGDQVIQAYLDTKNPMDTWVTRSIALAYRVTNRFWQRPRERLGLSAALGGTGICIATSVFARHPWDPGCLTEDLEFSMNVVLSGGRVAFAPETRTYDEKPLSLKIVLSQRSRWMQGHNDAARRLVGRLLVQAFRQRSWRALDAALYLLQPLRVLLAFVLLCSLGTATLLGPEQPALARAFTFSAASLAVGFVLFGVYPLICALAERARWRLLLAFPLVAIFSLTWIPAIALGLLRINRREWSHTPHTRATTMPQ